MKENCKLPKRLFLIEDYGIQGLRPQLNKEEKAFHPSTIILTYGAGGVKIGASVK